MLVGMWGSQFRILFIVKLTSTFENIYICNDEEAYQWPGTILSRPLPSYLLLKAGATGEAAVKTIAGDWMVPTYGRTFRHYINKRMNVEVDRT